MRFSRIKTITNTVIKQHAARKPFEKPIYNMRFFVTSIKCAKNTFEMTYNNVFYFGYVDIRFCSAVTCKTNSFVAE